MLNITSDGSGDHGSLVFEIDNKASSMAQITLFQTTPWYIKLFLHTLSISIDIPSHPGKADLE
jgi:hypothetical protein